MTVPKPSANSRLIMVVDDDRDVREALVDALEDHGWLLLAAPSGVAALRALQERASLPAVVIVDLMMPVMDGYGFVDAVRDDPRLARVPIMVLTASHGIDRTRLGKGTHVLTKPVSLAALVSTLDTIVLGIPGDLDARQPGSNEADADGALGIDSVQFASAQGVEPQFRLQSDGRLALREAVSESQEPSEEL